MDDEDSKAFADATTAEVDQQRPIQLKKLPWKYIDSVNLMKQTYSEEQLSSKVL